MEAGLRGHILEGAVAAVAEQPVARVEATAPAGPPPSRAALPARSRRRASRRRRNRSVRRLRTWSRATGAPGSGRCRRGTAGRRTRHRPGTVVIGSVGELGRSIVSGRHGRGMSGYRRRSRIGPEVGEAIGQGLRTGRRELVGDLLAGGELPARTRPAPRGGAWNRRSRSGPDRGSRL